MELGWYNVFVVVTGVLAVVAVTALVVIAAMFAVIKLVEFHGRNEAKPERPAQPANPQGPAAQPNDGTPSTDRFAGLRASMQRRQNAAAELIVVGTEQIVTAQIEANAFRVIGQAFGPQAPQVIETAVRQGPGADQPGGGPQGPNRVFQPGQQRTEQRGQHQFTRDQAQAYDRGVLDARAGRPKNVQGLDRHTAFGYHRGYESVTQPQGGAAQGAGAGQAGNQGAPVNP